MQSICVSCAINKAKLAIKKEYTIKEKQKKIELKNKLKNNY
jgi:hypothetical protein